MKAVILAAGRGSRMGGATVDSPKCMYPFRGKPLIEHIVGNLKKYFKPEDIYLVSGYRASQLNYLNLNTISNELWSTTNIMGSLQRAEHILESETTLITYSDIYYEEQAVSQILETYAPAIISTEKWKQIWAQRFEFPLEDLESFKISKLGTLERIGGRAEKISEIHGQFGGMYTLNPGAWNWIKDNVADLQNLDTTTTLNILVNRSPFEMNVVKYNGFWAEIDTLKDAQSQI